MAAAAAVVHRRGLVGSEQETTTLSQFASAPARTASAENVRTLDFLQLAMERPVIVVSAMGKTGAKLLEAGKNAVEQGERGFADLFQDVSRLHKEACETLRVDASVVNPLLTKLHKFLTGIALLGELSPRSQVKLVSFGERMSARIFAAYLNRKGVKARQYDGFFTTHELTNAGILDARRFIGHTLAPDWPEKNPVTTLGREGTGNGAATVIGRTLGLQDMQVDGVYSHSLAEVKFREPEEQVRACKEHRLDFQPSFEPESNCRSLTPENCFRAELSSRNISVSSEAPAESPWEAVVRKSESSASSSDSEHVVSSASRQLMLDFVHKLSRSPLPQPQDVKNTPNVAAERPGPEAKEIPFPTKGKAKEIRFPTKGKAKEIPTKSHQAKTSPVRRL